MGRRSKWPGKDFDRSKGVNVQIDKDESGQMLMLTGMLEIKVARDLQMALEEFVQRDSGTSLNLSGVDGCDTTAIQLLLSAQKTAQSAGKELQITAASDPVREVVALLGVGHLIACPESNGI